MNCPECGEGMKALFTGLFCPNDCDRPGPSGDGPGDTLAFDTGKASDGSWWTVSIQKALPTSGDWRGYWLSNVDDRERLRGTYKDFRDLSCFECRTRGLPGWPPSDACAALGPQKGKAGFLIFRRVK